MNIEAQSAGVPAHEQVYRQLRDQLLYGTLQPGAAVTIQGLQASMGVGMTPVREALRRLTAEGALHAGGNRRIVVPVLDADRIAELTEARLAIEPLLAEKAAKKADVGAIARLRTQDAALDTAIRRGDVAGYLRHNHAFHAAINACAEAPILSSLAASLWLRFGPSMRVVCGRFGTAQLPDRHKDLIDAFARADAAGAAQALRADIEQGMALVQQGL